MPLGIELDHKQETAVAVDGTVDWETFFDAPDTGIISMVNSAAKVDGLAKIMTVVIDHLFQRQDDGELREGYHRMVREIVYPSDGGTRDIATIRRAVVAMLGQIKEEQIQKREAYLAAEASGVVSGAPAKEKDAHESFIDMLCLSMRARFDALSRQDAENVPSAGKPPYFVSPEFADHFEDILRAEFFPELAGQAKALIHQANEKPAQERETFLSETLGGRKYRETLQEIWKTVWHDLVEEKETPDKPKKEKAGLVKSMLKKREDVRPWKRKELTPEQWEKAVEEIKAGNARARRVWTDISRDSDSYHPPEEGDKEVLMGLFGRTAEGIEKQMTALHQIASQGASTAAFDQYAQGRNLDMTLVAVSYRYPGLFLGEKGFLKQVLKGYDDHGRDLAFPQVQRFLGAEIA